MAEILIGTSGYSYNERVGCVYPEGTKQADFLSCYSELFPTVELNFSYYKMPVAVEFRKADWYSTKVADAMKSRNNPLVSLDMPELPKLPPSMDIVTGLKS